MIMKCAHLFGICVIHIIIFRFVPAHPRLSTQKLLVFLTTTELCAPLQCDETR